MANGRWQMADGVIPDLIRDPGNGSDGIRLPGNEAFHYATSSNSFTTSPGLISEITGARLLY